MFTLPKLLALAAIIGAVWYGFKFVGRLDEARKRKMAEDRAVPKNRATGRPPAPDADGVVDLVKDEETGSYVAPDKRDRRS